VLVCAPLSRCSRSARIAAHCDVRVFRQDYGVIIRRVFQIVDLAGLKRLDCRHRLGDVDPFDPVDFRDLTPREVVGRLTPSDGRGTKLAIDSLVEGSGFEPVVPLRWRSPERDG
jgi:hypothetical protein